VENSSSERFILLNRLVEEFAARYRKGERPALQEYIDRYPELADDIRDLFPALAEMEQVKADRRQLEEPPAGGPLPPLERLGDFRIIREIGRGGMGVVYEAEQVSLGRHVALKVLPQKFLVDARTKQRFEREAKAAARLHHTNIVPVFGVGEHDGLPYYVMQFIQGLGLHEVLQELERLQPGPKGSGITPCLTDGELRVSRRDVSAVHLARSLLAGSPESATGDGMAGGPSPDPPSAPPLDPPSSSSAVLPGAGRRPGERPATYWQSVARIGVQVAEALEHAHQQGITHRDVKPSNLLLDTRGTVWVTDFGLAKAHGQENLTHTGDILGTLRYMPPEAFDGQADARGDVYSLGMTLYELVALRPAFAAPERNQLIKRVTTTEPVPLERINPAVPRDLATILHKAIAREPGRRYPTAAALAADLQRFVDDRPIQARRVGAAERAWRWCRRNPLVAGLTAAVAFLLVAGTTVATYFAIDATLARDRADAEARNARSNARTAHENAGKEAAERQRADHEAAAARASLYIVRLNTIQMATDNANVGLARDLLESIRPPHPGQKDLPGWEWDYHWRLCHTELRTFAAQTEHLACVLFSPDGTRVACADNATVRVWDAATGRTVGSWTTLAPWIPCLAYSPDGARLAVSDGDGRVTVLDAAGLRQRGAIKAHAQTVRGVAFTPDGAQLVTAGEDGTLKRWDVAGGRPLKTYAGHGKRVLGVAISPDGQLVASADEDTTVRLWELTTGRPIRTLRRHTASVNGVAFSPDGRWLASAGLDHAVKVWDVATGQEIHTLAGHTAEVRRVVFSPDGTRLASGGTDQMVKVWDVHRGKEVTTFLGHTRGVYGVAFSPDGHWLASAGADRTVRLWNLGRRPGPRVYQGHDDQVRGVAFSPNGQRLASVGLDGRIAVRDVVTGQEQPRFPVGGARWLGLAYSPDGRLLASAGEDGTIAVWDADTGSGRWRVQGHTSWLSSLAFSPDGHTLASGGNDRLIKLWDATTGRALRTLSGHEAEVKGLVFNRDGSHLISGSDDHTVVVWDVATAQRLQVLQGHAKGVTDVALSPDGRWLASTSHDWTVKLWDLAHGQPLRTLKGHYDTAWSVVFSPDGTRLATAGWDQTVRLWDPATGFELATLKGHADRVLGLAFSPDGGLLASAGGKDRTVRVWDGRSLAAEPPAEDEAVALLDFLFSRPLPRADVLRYLRTTPRLRPPVRSMALTLAERYQEETRPEPYYAAAWPVVRHPYANDFVCRFALAQMNAACERAPDRPTYRLALGVAQYRLGRFQKERYSDALATLSRCDPSLPAVLAFQAMTQHQLGDHEHAQIARARLRDAMKESRWVADADAQAFLREAETLLDGNALKQ
jgi:WD40 repeat protein/serine/threonine protein kinase